MPVTSAGLLFYRRTDGRLAVLLAHMGGPFWARREVGAWTILKGEVAPDEDAHTAAVREAAEELGVPLPTETVPDLDLGEVRQRSGKRVRAWARRWPPPGPDPEAVRSNTVRIEWPPRSGRHVDVPEIDRVAWFSPDEARRVVVRGQADLVDRLERALDDRDAAT
ncbi:NUDIX domain-containing protein [Isoptericola sp. b515]|uniref:NUDIX domain-containing protein n=1 Tax=Isoptericola sp. b515 TaxID=3064652 RepID=UPI002712F999|nr:NUDIX domain-containing protein [Isoptericola sp. b515]MDO8148638.1 NUDIX domain-containing protein [Isoptericola sp. b515]